MNIQYAFDAARYYGLRGVIDFHRLIVETIRTEWRYEREQIVNRTNPSL